MRNKKTLINEQSFCCLSIYILLFIFEITLNKDLNEKTIKLKYPIFLQENPDTRKMVLKIRLKG